MEVFLQPERITDYRLFLKIKSLPRYRIVRNRAWFPDEYAHYLGLQSAEPPGATYEPWPGLFDYQRDISRLAIRKKKFGVFLDPGWGKTLCLLEFVRYATALLPAGQCFLIFSPLMVIRQTLEEAERFYGDSLPIRHLATRDLQGFLNDPEQGRVGIVNYEALTDKLAPGRLGGLGCDESSMAFKSHYGRWGRRLIDMGKGIPWKICLTGTPAPNDRIEYASHAVFLDQFPTVNSFLAKYFVNRGQTQERWELKPHALGAFYRGLSHWSVLCANPAAFGWKDNAATIPPLHVHIHDVELTPEQTEAVWDLGGDMYGTPGGITSRLKLSQLAKGRGAGGKEVATKKPTFIRDMIGQWRSKQSTIVWCKFNAEQDHLAKILPSSASMDGRTPHPERERMLADFKAGKVRTLISKPDVLGFGLNLQVATRHVFSTLVDSYEEFFQCVKRSNRVGSTEDLNVHLPVTSIERPMIDTVLRKAKRVREDGDEQQRIYLENRHAE